MESVPPSYEEATTKDYLSLVAPYIGSTDLCAASLVCKLWNRAFASWLWGRPASHFGLEDDRVYVALTRFKRTLPMVRLQVRELTHTLHLPPAHPELYGGPYPTWLKDVLLHLPHLQSLVVSSLPFFDHAALSSLRYDFPKSEGPKEPLMFPLRLLIAANCTNTTSRALDTALTCWPNLVFLDLTDTPAARDGAVLSRLKTLPSLQVVKLRHVDLRDQDLEILADAITTRVRSLDVRDNRLTDSSIRKLLSTCFNPSENVNGASETSRAYRRSFEGLAEEDWPIGVRRPADTLMDEFKGEELDQRFIRRLTNGSMTRLPSEDLPPPGLTHLYLGKNLFTVEGIASLLRTRNLHVLDVGKINTAKSLGRPGTRLSLTRPQENYVALPGVEKLAPVLGKYSATKLTYLRIHHELVTKPAPSLPPMAELGSEKPSTVPELDTVEAPIYELGETAPTYEMSDENRTPTYELPGDPVHMVISPAMNEAPRLNAKEEVYSQVRRGSAFAPEVNLAKHSNSLERLSRDRLELTPSGAAQVEDRLETDMASQRHDISKTKTPTRVKSDRVGWKSSSQTATEHTQDELRQTSFENGRGLLPGTLPGLRTLVLTNVPCTSNGRQVIDALKAFISDCANERKLAHVRAQFERNALHLPRNSNAGQHQDRSKRLFALRGIVLEMASPREASNDTPLSPKTPLSAKFPAMRDWSSTEDPDTEALWAAAENDFSFFGDEECGLPDNEPGTHFPRSTLSEKMSLLANDSPPKPSSVWKAQSKPTVIVDTIRELAAFRSERKAAFELAKRRGEDFVEGYWPGEVKVVRHPKGQKGYVNDYGAIF